MMRLLNCRNWKRQKNDIVSGDISFGYYHFTLMVMADSIRELDESVSKITADFTDLGIIPALSTMSLPAAYFAQLPAVFSFKATFISGIECKFCRTGIIP